MEKLKEGTKVTIDYNGGATGEIVGIASDQETIVFYIVKLIDRYGQDWKNYKYSCVVVPSGMLTSNAFSE